ncbi:PadR family transcriptional regulator [Paenibacillus sp. 481]|uniref:PadR family transcriptional regulator n=1 Tax=Paenibacillus sp. 481 TaxID=2835869 RepID=UPI001E48E9D2|nr:PadR family transcriptional regulator [Paenibacillus sp. 481]UHA75305.1 PadR family transcriptional regulator [Paenibacillus sp. 481]
MTRLMVLGLLLQQGPMSGYEMQSMMQSGETDTWAGVFPASIYHALRKLNEEGYVELEHVEKTGNRSKAIYRITEAGKEEFQKLLLASVAKCSVELPTELYTALTFHAADDVSMIALERALDEQEQVIVKMRQKMKNGQEAKAEHMVIPQHVLLIFENIYAQYELQLQMIQQVRDFLSTKSNKEK